MELLVVSFLAGVLTILSPCVLPVLPVVVGGASLGRPLVIIASLAASVLLFSLLLKASTLLLGVPTFIWAAFSGLLLIFLGAVFIWPALWRGGKISFAPNQGGLKKDVITGAALGPVFNSCSPTYALIVAVILPVSFLEGAIYLAAYTAGLSFILLLIALFGQAFVVKLGWVTSGAFRRVLGAVFIVVGLLVLIGADRDIQAFVIENGWYDPVKDLELRIRS